jgi:ribosomal protein L29
MEIDDLRKLSTERLLEQQKQTEMMIISCQQKMVHPVVPIGKRKDLKKRYARILTLLKERKENINVRVPKTLQDLREEI